MLRRAELETKLDALEKRVLSPKKQLVRIPVGMLPVGGEKERIPWKSNAHEVLFQWDKSSVCHDLQTKRSVVFGGVVSIGGFDKQDMKTKVRIKLEFVFFKRMLV